MKEYLILHEKDNVATALSDLEEGKVIYISEKEIEIKLLNEIQFRHKFALEDIGKGKCLFKYGLPIGLAYEDIKRGEHVHMHNLRTQQLESSDNEKSWSNRNV